VPALLLALGVLTQAGSARASGLEVEAWLRRPGVKLLAVEFYATWCKPCMEAVPRWKALHEKYKKDGLRLVVVAVQDPDGGCANPGWSPDDVVCDDDGRLAQRFGAATLPAAFLWSWQGHLLVQREHVEGVGAAIERWSATTPRVDVEVGDASGAGMSATALADLVRGRLRDEDKLAVVASAAERAKLDAVKARSLSARYDDKLQCELGQELSANSLLQVSVSRTGRRLLRLALLSAERGCLVAGAAVDWNAQKPAVSVAEAVSELLGKLRQAPRMPWGASAEPPRSGLSEYERMARELEAAKARARKRDEAWAIVQRVADAAELDRERRASALERFLADFPDDNPHEPEARRRLAALRPAPAVVPRAPPVIARPSSEPEAEAEGEGRATARALSDRDGDGLLDDDDACPDQPGFPGSRGCPDTDIDLDGVADVADECPKVPEDRDGFEDEDGCPDPDNDRDGVPDSMDKCPLEAETVNGFQDEDGCPDGAPKRVVVTRSSIEILERIGFARSGTYALGLPQRKVILSVADMLRSHPELQVELQGHTDSREGGDRKRQLALSERRAQTVLQQLVKAGVPASSLSARGYGPDLPIADNRTEKGRASNRRVEFRVIQPVSGPGVR
jgi:outer membrane protein OmpA-like peptidoglycan-associated protein/thiol-disulfide isomerase/thioredoxin